MEPNSNGSSSEARDTIRKPTGHPTLLSFTDPVGSARKPHSQKSSVLLEASVTVSDIHPPPPCQQPTDLNIFQVFSPLSTMSKQVLSSYLRAFRATRVAFDGDIPVLTAARAKIRDGFRNPDTSKSLEARLKEMNEISQFLVRNVVQGKKKQDKYLLNIHRGTELGDNESVKKIQKTLMAQGGGCCGGANAKI